MKNLQTVKQSVQKGFTLIELMIVVAIIGILAALAIPAYSDYTIKAKVAETAALSGAVKTAVELKWSESETLPGDFSEADLDGSTFSSKYVSSLSLQTGGIISIIITGINDTVNGTTVIYTPNTGQTNIVWGVGSSTVATKYRPKP